MPTTPPMPAQHLMPHEHYLYAERLLELAREVHQTFGTAAHDSDLTLRDVELFTQRAHVHALLATVGSHTSAIADSKAARADLDAVGATDPAVDAPPAPRFPGGNGLQVHFTGPVPGLMPEAAADVVRQVEAVRA